MLERIKLVAKVVYFDAIVRKCLERPPKIMFLLE